MSLAILKLRATEKTLVSKLEPFEAKRSELLKEVEIAKRALDEVESEEDLALASETADTLDASMNEVNEEISKINTELEETRSKISELESKVDEALNQKREKEIKHEKSGSVEDEKLQRGVLDVIREEDNRMGYSLRAKNEFERRERTRKVISDKERGAEVRSFYENVIDMAKGKKREVSNTDLLIPEIIMDMISIDMSYAGSVYSLVTVQPMKGTGRIILSGETPEALWVECCDPAEEVSLDFSQLELDCYMLASYVSICNSVLDDSFINLATHIQEQLTLSFVRALDKTILTGDGNKKPLGITKCIADDLVANKITTPSDFKEMIKLLGRFPDKTNQVTAVMTRPTYYTQFAPQTIATNSEGKIIAQSAENPRLPDGTPVVIVSSKALPHGEVIIGDFKKYLLVRRAGTEISTSTHVKFIQNHTIIKAIARYDGRPINAEYFLHLTLSDISPITFATTTAKTTKTKAE